MSSDSEVKCLVCDRRLGRQADAQGNTVGWEHGSVPEDGHLPEPVEAPEHTMKLVCDFCDTEVPDEWWTFPAHDLTQVVLSPGKTRTTTSIGEWLACDDCYPLVLATDWDAVFARWELRLVERGQPVSDQERPLLIAGLRQLWSEFHSARLGEPYRERRGVGKID